MVDELDSNPSYVTRGPMSYLSTLGCPKRYGFLGAVGTPVCRGSSTKTRVRPSSGHADGIASESSTHHMERCPGTGPQGPQRPQRKATSHKRWQLVF